MCQWARTAVAKRLAESMAYPDLYRRAAIAGLRCHERVAPWVIEGALNGEACDTYVTPQLAQQLRPGDVVVWDNLNVHKRPGAREAIRARGAWVLFLPRYSPALNPIETAFSKLKTLLRKRKARTYDALWKAVGHIYELFTPHPENVSGSKHPLKHSLKTYVVHLKCECSGPEPVTCNCLRG